MKTKLGRMRLLHTKVNDRFVGLGVRGGGQKAGRKQRGLALAGPDPSTK